jgi:hypothetical protein
MIISVPVGRYETANLKIEIGALHGNSKLGIFAGLLMGPFVKAICKKAGVKR